MIRVLHIVSNMNMGGIETMLMNYYRNIDREKIQFDFLCHSSKQSDYDNEILQLGGKIYRLPKLNPINPIYTAKLNNFFKKHQEYKIVHSHRNAGNGIILKYAEKNNIPIRIAHSHINIQNRHNVKYLVWNYYKKDTLKYSTHRLACSKEAGKWLYKNGSFDILCNAINTKQYLYNSDTRKCMRKKLKIDKNFVIGHVGRFTKQKNHYFLLDIFNEVLKIQPNAKLLLVGDGPLLKQTKQKTKKLNLQNNIMFMGIRNDVPEIMQAMDTFIMPSLYEGLGIVNIEAQAAGLPCVISNAIPKECVITDLVTECDLNQPSKYWAKLILEKRNIKRQNKFNEILKAGYDITSNAKYYENFCLSLLNFMQQTN